MAELLVAHTGQLDPALLRAAHDLLGDCFDDLEPADWEHCLGGLHALLVDGSDVLGHAALVQRRLLHRGRALRAGYVEGVAVSPDLRGRGHGRTLLQALEGLAHRAYEVAALGSSDAALAFYRRRGWQPWRGSTWVLSPAGVVRTEQDDDAVHVLPLTAELDLGGDLVCDWRDGDPW